IFAVGTVAQTEIPCARTYTVRPGDTCDAIAADQGVSSFQLAASNSCTINEDCTNIFPGQASMSTFTGVICLQRVCLDCNDVHVVAAGDTCTSIADEAGITVPTLEANNPNIAPNCDIRAGQVSVNPHLLIVSPDGTTMLQVLCVAQSL
ncbi:hypothetical protein PLEOSDRAFT_1038797, partial [Pleurotus ostreatus PC15]